MTTGQVLTGRVSAGPQVAGLRAARDKLLLELDEQAAEAQRLALENGALQQVRPSPYK